MQRQEHLDTSEARGSGDDTEQSLIHLKHESDEWLRIIERRSGRDHSPIKKMRIQPRAAELLKPPAFLERTATRNDYQGFVQVLAEINELNMEFVGERFLDCKTYLRLTDTLGQLIDHITSWCQSYFVGRVNKSNPRDQADPLEMWLRLKAEFRQLTREGSWSCESIDGIVWCRCRERIEFLLFESTWMPAIRSSTSREGKTVSVGQWTSRRNNAREICEKYLTWIGWPTSHLERFLEKVQATVSQVHDETMSSTIQELKDRCEGMMDDIMYMRPFLVRNFHPWKTAWEIRSGENVILEWSQENYPVTLYTAPSGFNTRGITSQSCPNPPIGITLRGLLCDGVRTWITTETLAEDRMKSALAVNVCVLKQFWERIFSFYEKIDFERIRKHRESGATETESTSVDEELIALSYQQIAADESEVCTESRTQQGRQRIPCLHLNSLLNILEKDLKCDVRNAKGSEIVVYRKDGRNFRIGCHKPNQKVHPILVKRLLKRVNISRKEWLAAVRQR